jgi:hypothetical protein
MEFSIFHFRSFSVFPIKLDLNEIWFEDVHLTYLAQGAVGGGGYSKHGDERPRSMKGGVILKNLVTISFSRTTLLSGVSYMDCF